MSILEPNTKCLARLGGEEGTTRPVEVIGQLPVGTSLFSCRDLETQQVLTVDRSRLMPTQSIASRFKRSSFDRYARIMGEALKAFPAAITVDTGGLSVETYAARFRDARTAKQQ